MRPENVDRTLTCPLCGTTRATRAHPNTILRCRGCSARYRVPAGDEAPEVTDAPPAAGSPSPATSPSGQPEPAAPAPGDGDPAADTPTILTEPVTFPPADPPPAGHEVGSPDPRPGAEPTLAGSAGVVTEATPDGVEVDHGGGLVTRLSHGRARWRRRR